MADEDEHWEELFQTNPDGTTRRMEIGFGSTDRPVQIMVDEAAIGIGFGSIGPDDDEVIMSAATAFPNLMLIGQFRDTEGNVMPWNAPDGTDRTIANIPLDIPTAGQILTAMLSIMLSNADMIIIVEAIKAQMAMTDRDDTSFGKLITKALREEVDAGRAVKSASDLFADLMQFIADMDEKKEETDVAE